MKANMRLKRVLRDLDFGEQALRYSDREEDYIVPFSEQWVRSSQYGELREVSTTRVSGWDQESIYDNVGGAS